MGERSPNPKRRPYAKRVPFGVRPQHPGDAGAPHYFKSQLLRWDYRFSQRMAEAGYARREDK